MNKDKIKFSLLLMIRDEEKLLPRALSNITEIFDEIIIVDTGSNDSSTKIAKEHGALVHNYEWDDSFSNGRNFGLEKCTGDYVLMLDADEFLDEANAKKLGTLKENTQNKNYAFIMNRIDIGSDSNYNSPLIRLFPVKPTIRCRYRVHEKISDTIVTSTDQVIQTDINIFRERNESPEERLKKSQYYEKLLQKDRIEMPEDIYVIFNLTNELIKLNRFEEAEKELRLGIDLIDKDDSLAPHFYNNLAHCTLKLGKPNELSQVIEESMELFPHNYNMRFLLASLYHAQGIIDPEMDVLNQIIELTYEDAKQPIPPQEIARESAMHYLAKLHTDVGEFDTARKIWTHLLSERPQFAPAKEAIEELDRRG